MSALICQRPSKCQYPCQAASHIVGMSADTSCHAGELASFHGSLQASWQGLDAYVQADLLNLAHSEASTWPQQCLYMLATHMHTAGRSKFLEMVALSCQVKLQAVEQHGKLSRHTWCSHT